MSLTICFALGHLPLIAEMASCTFSSSPNFVQTEEKQSTVLMQLEIKLQLLFHGLNGKIGDNC